MAFFSRFWAWRDRPPWHVGSCPTCGCLVLLLPYSDGRAALFDPPFAARRWLRSILAPASVACQGFAGLGARLDADHVCPPAAECALPRAPQRRLAYRTSIKGAGAGPGRSGT